MRPRLVGGETRRNGLPDRLGVTWTVGKDCSTKTDRGLRSEWVPETLPGAVFMRLVNEFVNVSFDHLTIIFVA